MQSNEEKNIEIQEYFKDFLKVSGYKNTLICFQSELRASKVNKALNKKSKKPSKNLQKYEPKIYAIMKGVNHKNQQQFEQEDQLTEMKKKYNEVVLASKHIFQVAV